MATAILNKTPKKTTVSAQIVPQNHGNGFFAADLSLQRFPIDPFIVATDFHMSQPFFPPHPHAGVSVLTYIFEDSENAFINRDSFGDHSRIEPGGLHLTQAGRGVQHEEIPETPGIDAHGLQLWVNHSAENRLVEARAFHAKKAEIRELRPTENTRIRILLGELDGVKSTVQAITPVSLLDAHAGPNGRILIDVPAGFNSWVFMIKGVGNLPDGTVLGQYGAAIFAPEGDQIDFLAGENGAHFLVGMGLPLNESNVFGGPFVMTTADQLLETKRRFGRGEMGELKPSAQF